MSNHLTGQKSPYLLQHSENPVDWYPWGQAAFTKARQEDKPIFLSIGYSVCHWCHVMNKESFEDAEVAAALNRDFVAIKVDREERPDIDAVYMSVCQALTGSGGWPLTILMTAEQKPFFAATYLPKTSRFGQPGLLELLAEVQRMWKEERQTLLADSEKVAAFCRQAGSAAAAKPQKKLLEEAARLLAFNFDRRHGGFGQAPKFPAPHNLLFLLDYAQQEKDRQLLDMVEHTLEAMYRGGIFDHIGGGFCRYATDRAWLVPHFEKMLYDNALLAYVYLEAYRICARPLYREVAERTLAYVLEELAGAEGGFCSSQDADSEGEEGKYYLFTPTEVCRVLGEDLGAAFCRFYDITQAGNFEGRSIPNLLQNREFESVPPALAAARFQLAAYRKSRMSLHRDDKVLTAWNGMMIATLAKAYRVLGAPAYLRAAQNVRDFLQSHLQDADGRLRVRYREGEAAFAGHLDDYAYFAWGLLELYQAELDIRDLAAAVNLTEKMEQYFWDGEAGGFYLYAADSEQLIARPKELYDGAMPAGNSMAAWLLWRVARLLGTAKWQQLADKQLRFLAGNVKQYPAGHTFALFAIGRALGKNQELVCATRAATPALLAELRNLEGPHVLLKTAANAAELAAVAPYTADYPLPAEGAAYYLCENGACQAPVSDLQEILY